MPSPAVTQAEKDQLRNHLKKRKDFLYMQEARIKKQIAELDAAIAALEGKE